MRKAHLLAIAALIIAVAACGDDDDTGGSNDTTAVETTAVDTTDVDAVDTTDVDAVDTTDVDAVDTTVDAATDMCEVGEPSDDVTDDPTVGNPQIVTCQDEMELTLRADGPCLYRPGELVTAQPLTDDDRNVLIELGAEIGDPIAIASDDAVNNTQLYPIDGRDALDAAVLLASRGAEAAPNYIIAFAPGWKYSPHDSPTPVASSNSPDSTSVPPAPTAEALDELSTPRIAVFDTGYEQGGWASNVNVYAGVHPTEAPANRSDWVAASDEVMDGAAAGHGTFIVNLLAALLPNASLDAIPLHPRTPGDNDFVVPPEAAGDLPPGERTSVRDDVTLSYALEHAYDASSVPDVINISGGTHGCAAEVTAAYAGLNPTFREILATRDALRTLSARNPELIVTAASGNDGHHPASSDGSIESHGEGQRFYPAAFAANSCFLSPPSSQGCVEAGGALSDWLISVGSDPKGSEDYSNRGVWVTTQARGSNVVSWLPPTKQWPSGGVHAWSGTSFAAPCVAALLASASVPTLPASSFPGDPNATYAECGANLSETAD